MSDRIYTRANGRMEELREQSFGNDPESVLQKLIAQHPDLLSGEQLSPENPLRWILITREPAAPPPAACAQSAQACACVVSP